jgi:hypothetical protein
MFSPQSAPAVRKMRPSGGWTPGTALAGVLVQHEHTRTEIGLASRAWCSGGAVSSDSIRCREDDGVRLGQSGLLGCTKRLGCTEPLHGPCVGERKDASLGWHGVSAQGHFSGLNTFLFSKLFCNWQITLNSTQI